MVWLWKESRLKWGNWYFYACSHPVLPRVKELAGLAALDKEHGQRERDKWSIRQRGHIGHTVSHCQSMDTFSTPLMHYSWCGNGFETSHKLFIQGRHYSLTTHQDEINYPVPSLTYALTLICWPKLLVPHLLNCGHFIITYGPSYSGIQIHHLK